MNRIDEEKMVMDDVGCMHQNLLQASDQGNWLQGYLRQQQQRWGLLLVLPGKVGSWVVVLVDGDQKAVCVGLGLWHDSSW